MSEQNISGVSDEDIRTFPWKRKKEVKEYHKGWTRQFEKKLKKQTLSEDIYRLTYKKDEHPEHYDGPCYCKLCQSYNDR